MSSCSRPLRDAVRATTLSKLLLSQPGGEVDVVRCQIFDDPNVGNPGREGALTAGGNLVDLTQLALPRAAASKALQRWVEPFDMPNGSDQAPSPQKLSAMRATGGGIVGNRLFHRGMNACVGELSRQFPHEERSEQRRRPCRYLDRSSSSTLLQTFSPSATPWGSPKESATATKSTPSSSRRTRAWWRPIIPSPIRPARKFAT